MSTLFRQPDQSTLFGRAQETASRGREPTGGSLSSSTSAVVRQHDHPRSRPRPVNKDMPSGRKESITYKLEWRIDEVAQLAAHVEGWVTGAVTGEESDSPSEVLRAGRKSADGMYKFDLGATTDDVDEASSPGDGNGKIVSINDGITRRLSLFICCTALESRFTADLSIGITAIHIPSGQEAGATRYLWSYSQSHEFCPNDDYARIPLPVLSDLIKHPSVEAHNAFTICITITEVYGAPVSTQPAGVVSVPTDLITALGGLVDHPAGADVRFVCLEYRLEPEELGVTRRESSGSEASAVSGGGMSLRKRVLYANSQILSGRSDYFADLFKGDFAESQTVRGERYRTIVVEGANFETVYWMLRFVYTNELLFDESDDRVRELLRQHSIDSSIVHQILRSPAPSLINGDEWRWHNTTAGEDDLSSIDHDCQSITSSAQSNTTTPLQAARSPTAPTASSVAKASTPRAQKSETIASPSSRASSGRTVGKGPHPTRSTATAAAASGSASATTSESDPHAHPCVQPAPACALAIYMLAHQYRLEVLERMAKKHILSHLTHSTCIAVLYPDLHEAVLRYIHAEWKDVKHDAEFVRCFQEVARGAWGEEGGTILADMVARLPY